MIFKESFMKTNFLRLLLFMVICIVLSIGLIYLIPDQYTHSYQRALIRQYDYYRSLDNDENRIIVVGYSSLSFGFDLDLMKELTGRPCVVMGNHSGYGGTFCLQLIKDNLKQGDIVVIEAKNSPIDEVGGELLLTSIGKRFELYKCFIPEIRLTMAKAFPSYIRKSIERMLDGGQQETGPYSIDAYDEHGNMTFPRSGLVMTREYIDNFNEIVSDYQFFTMNDSYVSYLQDYVDYCNAKGVKVYFVTMVSLTSEGKMTKEGMERDDRSWADSLPAPYISHREDYIYPVEDFYNAPNHLNDIGVEKRTRQIYEDLKPYL